MNVDGAVNEGFIDASSPRDIVNCDAADCEQISITHTDQQTGFADLSSSSSTKTHPHYLFSFQRDQTHARIRPPTKPHASIIIEGFLCVSVWTHGAKCLTREWKKRKKKKQPCEDRWGKSRPKPKTERQAKRRPGNSTLSEYTQTISVKNIWCCEIKREMDGEISQTTNETAVREVVEKAAFCWNT